MSKATELAERARVFEDRAPQIQFQSGTNKKWRSTIDRCWSNIRE
jgi:hypothetical protein